LTVTARYSLEPIVEIAPLGVVYFEQLPEAQ
jgi:hypothetical protein